MKGAGCWVRGIGPFRKSWLTNELLCVNCYSLQQLLAAGLEKHEAVNYFRMKGVGRHRAVKGLHFLGSKMSSKAESLTFFSCSGVAEWKQGLECWRRRLMLIHLPLIMEVWRYFQFIREMPTPLFHSALFLHSPLMFVRFLRIIKIRYCKQSLEFLIKNRIDTIYSVRLLLEERKKKWWRY